MTEGQNSHRNRDDKPATSSQKVVLVVVGYSVTISCVKPMHHSWLWSLGLWCVFRLIRVVEQLSVMTGISIMTGAKFKCGESVCMWNEKNSVPKDLWTIVCSPLVRMLPPPSCTMLSVRCVYIWVTITELCLVQ